VAKVMGSQYLAGKRTTHQRRALLSLILKAAGHLDADELYRRAREQEPSISLSTVYRNLTLFKKLGLVEERHFGEEHHHYEAKGVRQHDHLVCLGCGQVVEFASPLVEELKREVEMKNRFRVADAEVRVIGYCARCRRKADSK